MWLIPRRPIPTSTKSFSRTTTCASLNTATNLESTQPHEHPDSVMYTLSSFERRLVAQNGKTHDVNLAAGEVRWLDAQVHSGENIGQNPTHVLFVELKRDSPVPGIGNTALRPS